MRLGLLILIVATQGVCLRHFFHFLLLELTILKWQDGLFSYYFKSFVLLQCQLLAAMF